MNNKGFKEYQITSFNSDTGIRGTEIKIKAGEEDINLDSNTSSLNLTGTNLTVINLLKSNHRKVITGNFYSTKFMQGIRVLGAEIDRDTDLTLSIQAFDKNYNESSFEESYEWNRKIYTANKEDEPFIIKKNESALTPEEKSKVNTEIWISNRDYDGEYTKQLGLNIYMDEKSLDKLVEYIERDILKSFEIYIWSERIFTERVYLDDETLDRYLLFNASDPQRSILSSIFGNSLIRFISKETVKEDDIVTEEDEIIPEKEIKEKEIVIQKEKNYESKLNFILILLIVIAVGIFIK